MSGRIFWAVQNYQQILLIIREQRSINMPVEQKLEILDSLSEPENAPGIFIMAPEKTRQYERKNILRIGKIRLALAAIPFQLLHLSRKIKHCPETVKTDGNALWIGTAYW